MIGQISLLSLDNEEYLSYSAAAKEVTGSDANVDKLSVVQAFERAAFRTELDGDGIRLFLLLLAGTGQEGSAAIAYRAIRAAMGEEFSPARLRGACHELGRHGLMEVVSLLPDDPGDDFILVYRIMPDSAAEV